MNKKQNCNEKDCNKMEHYAVDLVAYTMKMQCAITKKLEEARAYDCKAEEIIKKARILENQSDALMKEAEEMSKQLEIQLKKANILMLKTIECYKENCEEEKEESCHVEEQHHHQNQCYNQHQHQHQNQNHGCYENNCGCYNEAEYYEGCNGGCFEGGNCSSNNHGCNGHPHINECYRNQYQNNGFRYEEGHNMNGNRGMDRRENDEYNKYWYN